MSIKSDLWIRKMAEEKKMIEPFEPTQVRHGVSYGLSSYGYDFRLGSTFKIYQPQAGDIIDPKNFSALYFEEFTGDVCEIPPRSFVLGTSLEYFRIPRNILTICYGKSTYARCGIFLNVTPFEPEWEGFATLAIYNHQASPALVYAGEGIGQLLFLESDEMCATSYADKKGKYQSQTEITGAKI
ncbi:MAG: dCTP deaminase [Deltaproteobacteria bacterium]|nr:dCTP deaminase [Deltaproteobacteria bacterium]